MFLWQKYKYNLTVIRDIDEFNKIKEKIRVVNPKIIAWDTETTGLHLMKDKPFLIGFGYDKQIFIYEPSIKYNNILYDIARNAKYFIAHNAKFDFHMMHNFGSPIPDYINIADSLALARITDYVDSLSPISLEHLGHLMVDNEAKFAGRVIKHHINEINRSRRNIIKDYVRNNLKISYTQFMKEYKSRVQFVETDLDEHFDAVSKLAPDATYKDSYEERPNIMINYLADDIMLCLEITTKLLNVLDVIDKDRLTWHRENKLIRVVGNMERTGLNADIDYLLQSRLRVIDEIKNTYDSMYAITIDEFTVMQHKVLKNLFATKYKIGTESIDKKSLDEIIKYYDGDAAKVATYIDKLRTLEKWLSTYINGMLNRIYMNKIYTNINNSGTSTGRVSSDMQQQPSYALMSENGTELFHPRKVFINEEGSKNFYIDFNNMELRVQAYYTMLVGDGDINMCSAFIPFKHYNAITGKMYDPVSDFNSWNSGNWVNENGESWRPTDLHTATALKAFPDITTDHPDFKSYYRDLGKRANFLKNYGGGIGAILEQLGVSRTVAEALNSGYYEAFPNVLDYQSWVDRTILAYGNIKNLLGRPYYFQSTQFSYRGYNYLIQGSCADYVKIKQIELMKFLKPYKSKLVLPIHDEIIFKIVDGEEFLIDRIKEIMEEASFMMPTIPMTSEVSYTDTNWAEKRKWKNAK